VRTAFFFLILGATLIAAAGCSVIGTPKDPIPTVRVDGNDPSARVLVVVLPGFIYDADDLRDKGVADVIHRGWPAADIALVGATFNYYRSGLLVPRLHEQVIKPAREQGYRQIWLIGGSMGGMGVLLYEWHHPGELTGIIMLSPFLGSGSVLDEIRAAGLARWDPGLLSSDMTEDNYQRQVWKMIKGWRDHPELARRVWLACGTGDHLYPDVQLLAPQIRPDQYIARPGGHNWDFWLPVAEEIFRKIAAARPQD
jgi:pimeloyl-ACP methyl ester carboxylesterase